MKSSENITQTVKSILMLFLTVILISATIGCTANQYTETVPSTDEGLSQQYSNLAPMETNQETQPEDGEEQDPETLPLRLNSFDSDVNLLDLFNAFWTARELLHDNFLEQPVDDRTLAAGALNGIVEYLETNNIPISTIELPADAPTAEMTARQANTPKEVIETFSPFWEAWNKLSYLELPDDATPTTMMRFALTGMVAALDDPYTNYRDPELSERWNTQLSGEYEGIGAWVDVETEFLTIISPIQGTPAEEAGLRPGDQIIAVDGIDMTGVDPNVVLKRVVGDAGTKVILTIAREDIEPFDVEIIREKITLPYIESEILEGGIAYLRLVRFYNGADLDLRETMADLFAQNPKALIFDLRGNGGGYLHTVVNITSEFITEENVLIEVFSDGSEKTYPTRSAKGIATEIPLVVLIDEGSASASEIFAGAVKDYQRGILVGQTTFGKGVVQVPVTLPDDHGTLSITIAKWLTPNGTEIHEIGIDPDYFVEYTMDDFDQGLDPQLDKAIELLTTGQ